MTKISAKEFGETTQWRNWGGKRREKKEPGDVVYNFLGKERQTKMRERRRYRGEGGGRRKSEGGRWCYSKDKLGDQQSKWKGGEENTRGGGKNPRGGRQCSGAERWWDKFSWLLSPFLLALTSCSSPAWPPFSALCVSGPIFSRPTCSCSFPSNHRFLLSFSSWSSIFTFPIPPISKPPFSGGPLPVSPAPVPISSPQKNPKFKIQLFFILKKFFLKESR